MFPWRAWANPRLCDKGMRVAGDCPSTDLYSHDEIALVVRRRAQAALCLGIAKAAVLSDEHIVKSSIKQSNNPPYIITVF